MEITSKIFWMKTTERAVKSAAQAVLLAWGLSDNGPVNALVLDYKLAAGVALGGALLSVLTSLLTSSIGPPNDPSAI